MPSSWVVNNCLHLQRCRGVRKVVVGREAILGKGLTGPEASGGKSQISTMTRKPLGLSGVEAAGRGGEETS